MNTIFVVKYYGGSYSDFYDEIVFATTKKSTATKYVTKFNGVLKKWKDYYSQFEENRYGIKTLKNEHIDQHFYRWNRLRDFTKCYWEEVQIR